MSLQAGQGSDRALVVLAHAEVGELVGGHLKAILDRNFGRNGMFT